MPNICALSTELSFPFSVRAGVRQGGILSPAFFVIYIDVLIAQLLRFIDATNSVIEFCEISLDLACMKIWPAFSYSRSLQRASN